MLESFDVARIEVGQLNKTVYGLAELWFKLKEKVGDHTHIVMGVSSLFPLERVIEHNCRMYAEENGKQLTDEDLKLIAKAATQLENDFAAVMSKAA